MNKFFFISIISFLSVLMVQSCDSQKTVLDNVPEDKLEKTYTVSLSDTLEIKLASNPTTGFSWNLTSKIKPRIVKELGNKYVEDNKSMSIMGMGGIDTWSFLPKKEGILFMNFKYTREDGKMDKEKFFKIIVKK